ncbi:MAG: hypothetical protein IM638_07745 [Bacteroidetes bacterium]|nr:hypothetical protein [Bacteroidota bacterium]
MKSSLRSMANHYHVEYASLLLLISQAAQAVPTTTSNRTAFLDTLNRLLDELNNTFAPVQTEISSEQPARMLEDLFGEEAGPVSQRRKEFTDLILFMAENDSDTAAFTLRTLFRQGKIDETKIGLLERSALESALEVLAGASRQLISESIRFLDFAIQQTRISLAPDFVISRALMYLLEKENQSAGSLFSALVAELAGQVKVDMRRFIFLLYHLAEKNTFRSAELAGLLDEASVFAGSELLNHKPAGTLSETGFHTLLRFLKKSDLLDFTSGHAVLPVKWLLSNPLEAFETVTPKNRGEVAEKIARSLSCKEIHQLAVHASSDLAQRIILVAIQLEAKDLEKPYAALARRLLLFFRQLAVKTIFLPLNFSGTSDFAYRLRRFLITASLQNRLETIALTEVLASLCEEPERAMLHSLALHLQSRAQLHVSRLADLNTILQHPEQAFTAAPDVARAVLRDAMSDEVFIRFRKQNSQSRTRLLRAVHSGSQMLFEEFLPKLLKWIKQENPAVPLSFLDAKLNDIFWSILLGQTSAKQSKQALICEMVRASVFLFPETVKSSQLPEYFFRYFSMEELRRLFPLATKPEMIKMKVKSESRSLIQLELLTLHKLPGPVERISVPELVRLLRDCIITKSHEVTVQQKVIDFASLFRLAMQKQPSQLRALLNEIAQGEVSRRFISEHISLEEFLMWMHPLFVSRAAQLAETFRFLSLLAARLSPAVSAQLVSNYWTLVFDLLRGSQPGADEIEKTLKACIAQLLREGGTDTETIYVEIRRRQPTLSPMLNKCIASVYPALVTSDKIHETDTAESLLEEAASRNLLSCWVRNLVAEGEIPHWAGAAGATENEQLLVQIVKRYPAEFYRALHGQKYTIDKLETLADKLPLKYLLEGMSALYPERESYFEQLLAAFHLLGKTNVQGITASKLQHVFYGLILHAFISGNLRIISSDRIWQEFFWELITRQGLKHTWIVSGLMVHRLLFPPVLRIALEKMAATNHATTSNAKQPQPALRLPYDKTQSTPASSPVRNAGLVLLNSYLGMLFSRLGLTASDHFVGKMQQEQAIHYSQYVVSGLTRTDETDLLLNKVLCGWPVHEPVTDGIEISEENRKLIDSLIRAAVSHWPVIGTTSVEGFRGNWLVRDGLLTQYADKWELTVEKRPYDVLLNKAPYSFSIIRFPWMEFPVHVKWNY